MLQCPQVQVYFFMCMCVAMVCILALWSVWGPISFLLFSGCFHFCVFFVFLVKGLLDTFPRCYHIDRVQVTVRGYRSKVMGACPAPLSAYICIRTAGKLGLDVTSVPGSSLQLSYIKWEMADINSATCTTAYKLLVPLQLSLYTRCLVPSLLEVQ